MVTITPFQLSDGPDLVALWNVGAGHVAPLDARAWDWLTTRDPAFEPGGLLVARTRRGLPVGFVLAKLPPPGPGLARYTGFGWVSALAVAPEAQGQGLGRALLTAGEAWLRRNGAREAWLGGSFHHHVPGVPANLHQATAFFDRAGYRREPDVWDVFRDLKASSDACATATREGVVLRPGTPDDGPALLEMLCDEFPGRWPHDLTEALTHGASGPEDVLVATSRDGLVGFAHLHPPGSPGTWRWAAGVPAVAALGPLGVAAAARGTGLGRALLAGGLASLASRGAGPCVIDWTDLLDFYALAGFSPWRCYHRARRSLT